MIDGALNVTARALQWQAPEEDDGIRHGVTEDTDAYAIGFGGLYCVVGPRIVPIAQLKHAKRSSCVEIDGLLHYKALLWWASEPFTHDEYDTVEAAKLAAEADWQTRFREAIASVPLARGTQQ